MVRTLALLSLLAAASVARGQTPSDVPSEARRRIAQAIWPENLFDSAGRPEPGFVQRTFQPTFADLAIRAAPAPASLPGVTIYVGKALRHCTHCRSRTVVVARRGARFVSLLGPGDVQYLAPWIAPEALRDSLALRDFVVAALRATGFLGGDARAVRRRGEIPDADSPFLRPAGDGRREWRLPRTYFWQRGGGVLVEFPLYAPGYGVYEVRADYQGGDRLSVSVSPVAQFVL